MNLPKLLSLSALLFTLALPSSTYAATKPVVQPPVKRSVNMLCHAKGTRYYKQTTRFTSFKTLKDCLKSGGKMPKK